MIKKQGITMVVLVATVVIAVIIMSASVLAIKNSTKNATLSTFREELVNISQAVENYYLLNKAMPTYDQNSNSYSVDEIENLTLSKQAFNEEINLNNEEENTSFYKVDLSKINVNKTVRGNKKNNDESDIYIVAYPSFNVYYLKGLNVDNVYYFSYIKFSESINKIEQSKNVVAEITQGDLKVKKNVKVWTNKLGIEITTFIEEGNSLRIKYLNNSEEVVSNIVNFTSDKIGKTNVIKIDDLIDVGFTSAQSEAFKKLSQNKKKITIEKLESQNFIAQVEVDVSNYETTLPSYSVSDSITSTTDYNLISVDVEDSISGVDKFKYEYYKKVTFDGEMQYFTDANTYSRDNLMLNGKEAKIINGVVTVKVPKDIVAIKCVISDKAGNATNVIEINTKTAYYSYFETVKGTKNSISFKINAFKKSGVVDNISKITTKISNDGINYTSENDYKNTEFTYTDIENMGEYIYIIVTLYTGAENSYQNVDQRRIQIDTSSFISEGTKDKSVATWENPYIPEGFVHTEGNVKNGFVISDVTESKTKYNEFVWVPVEYIYDNTTLPKETDIYDESTVKNSKLQNLRINVDSNTKKIVKVTGDEQFYIDSLNNSTSEYTNMIKSVRKYGGFYVARYEAGDFNAVNERTSSNIANLVLYKKGLYPYNYISLEQAISKSRSMYSSSTDITSHLMYGCQWDAIMHWINLEKNGINSIKFGNYSNSNFTNSGVLNTTGKNEAWVTNKIYDLAGNVEEMTMEIDGSSNLITRGGSYLINAEALSIALKKSVSIDELSNKNISFRTVLYIN